MRVGRKLRFRMKELTPEVWYQVIPADPSLMVTVVLAEQVEEGMFGAELDSIVSNLFVNLCKKTRPSARGSSYQQSAISCVDVRSGFGGNFSATVTYSIHPPSPPSPDLIQERPGSSGNQYRRPRPPTPCGET